MRKFLMGWLIVCWVCLLGKPSYAASYEEEVQHILNNLPQAEESIRYAQQGDKSAQFILGLQYMGGLSGLQQDYGKAVYWMEKSADQGEPLALCFLGIMYKEGIGVPKDEIKGEKLTRMGEELLKRERGIN